MNTFGLIILYNPITNESTPLDASSTMAQSSLVGGGTELMNIVRTNALLLQ